MSIFLPIGTFKAEVRAGKNPQKKSDKEPLFLVGALGGLLANLLFARLAKRSC